MTTSSDSQQPSTTPTAATVISSTTPTASSSSSSSTTHPQQQPTTSTSSNDTSIPPASSKSTPQIKETAASAGNGSAADGDEDMGEVDGGENAGNVEEQDSMEVDDKQDVKPKPDADISGKKVVVKDLERRAPVEAKTLAIQNETVIMPSYSVWFSFSNIHDIERKALPEFFNGRNKSKTPQIYKDYRDFIINTYRLNPAEYLTVTACRRNLAGDVCAIIRVHNFLEQWGLINYQVDPDSKPIVIGPAYTGHFRITADTPRGFQPLGPQVPMTARETSSQNKGMIPQTPMPTLPPSLAPTVPKKRSNDEATGAEGEAGASEVVLKKPKHSCKSCGVACSELHYVSTKSKDLVVCKNCFLEGRYPSTASAADFLRKDDRDQSLLYGEGTPWTDQETLLLLEGLEMFSDHWDKIADHVGTRTREQCILKFLDIPIEDPFLEETNANLGPLQFAEFPFAASDSPVLSVVAMLASIVKPEVAKASAKAAMEAIMKLTEEDEIKAIADSLKLKEEAEKAKEGEKEKEKEKEVKDEAGAMEVDGEKNAEAGATAEGEKAAEGDGAAKDKSAEEASAEPKPNAPAGDAMEVDKEKPKEDGKPADSTATAEKEGSASEAPKPDAAPAPTAEEIKKESEVNEAKTKLDETLSNAIGHDGKKVGKVERMAATALGAAAAKAYTIAHAQEEECRRLVERVIELQLQKLSLKMEYFKEIEAVVDAEREDLARQKKGLALERAALRKEKAAFYAARTGAAATTPVSAHPVMVTGGVLDPLNVQQVQVGEEEKETLGSNVIFTIG
ncbi:hypothetical protein HDU97_001718 [Phlyctochytrium planicorne]|nr:hypothetical protein HDU97_001718 [Phlyctochytrium planicorne]